MDRRDFLKVMGIVSGTSLITSCGLDKSTEKIIPYVIPPDEDVVVGVPLLYNTTCTECPAHCGVQVNVYEKVYDERRSLFPTKLEGIKAHPVNDGALCMRGQASLMRLYHPDRIKRPLMRHKDGSFRIATWNEVFSKIGDTLADAGSKGQKSYYLSARTTGTLAGLIDQFCKEQGAVRVPEYEAFSHATVKQANKLMFDRGEIPHYRIEDADFLLTLGADIFETFISPVSYAMQFARASEKPGFFWYHVEPHVSLTGVHSDRRLVVKPESEKYLLAYILKMLASQNSVQNKLPADIIAALPVQSAEEVSGHTGLSVEQLNEIVNKFSSARSPLVISGSVSTANSQGLEVAMLTGLIQWATGMTETVVDFAHAEDYSGVGTLIDMQNLLDELDKSPCGVLFISRTDPLSTLPTGLDAKSKFAKAALKVGLSDIMNDTMKMCDIILPLSHNYESWGDAVPRHGILNAIQPAIEPQYDSKNEGDILLALLQADQSGAQQQSYQDYIFTAWKNKFGGEKVDKLVTDGFLEMDVPAVKVSLDKGAILSHLQSGQEPPSGSQNTLVVTPSIRSYDGRSSVLPLMQEIPDPLTAISYGEWVSLSEKDAENLGVERGDVVEITGADLNVKLPVFVQRLLPEKVLVIQKDLMTEFPSAIASSTGESIDYFTGLTLKKTGDHIRIPVLSGSENFPTGREIFPPEKEEDNRTLAEKRAGVHEHHHERLYPKHEHKTYRWGMTIDMDSCIACGACISACYVENNVPVVGREEHLKGREMSWIRLEPYYAENGGMDFMLMLCQQCDNAPCEPVCPVYATYHNPEGLNAQVYNRCVGTRYCSNNCPYKVRRFNWFDNVLPAPLDKMYNPNISVRGRGVMEKCTFCVQRIRAAKDHAQDENRTVLDGEVTPACAQTCPTKAITFGNLKDEASVVYKNAHSDEAYRVLEELGTEPAVHYLNRNVRKEEA